MSDTQGKFVWYELMTTDTKSAEAFYRSAVGWGAQDSGVPGMSYTLFTAGAIPTAGLMEIPQRVLDGGARPFWSGYVAVDDVDASAAAAKQGGATIHHAPDDIPGVGRFAVIGDPDGATLCLFKSANAEPPPPAPGTPGTAGWRELYAGDREASFAFYAKLFGWTKADALDMGPMGVYQLLARNGEVFGGMMTKPPQVPVPCWVYYFNVDAIDAAVERVKAGGGQVLNGPMQVPGGSWIIQCLDPQRAMFCLVAQRR
jgi:predicted enzyme related to lactoylglutathione lyase